MVVISAISILPSYNIIQKIKINPRAASIHHVHYKQLCQIPLNKAVISTMRLTGAGDGVGLMCTIKALLRNLC